jgi:hypothetical protein
MRLFSSASSQAHLSIAKFESEKRHWPGSRQKASEGIESASNFSDSDRFSETGTPAIDWLTITANQINAATQVARVA